MMSDFWNARSERERLVLMAGGAVAALALAFQAIYAPLSSWRDAARSEFARAEGFYALVLEAAAAAPAGDAEAATDTRPLRAIVATAAGDAGVELTFVSARPDGAVEANAGPTDPEAFFEWVAALSAEHGAKISYADISRAQDNDGTVRGRVIFSR